MTRPQSTSNIALQLQWLYLFPSNTPNLFSLNVFASAVFSALDEKVINSIALCQVLTVKEILIIKVLNTIGS